MSYIVVWGYKTGLTNKKFLGIKPCGNCGKFSERYLAKSFFRINLFWFLPIFGVPTGKYLRCANCDGVRKLTRAEWNELKESARFMPKKKDYLRAYEELKGIVISSAPEELTTTTIYSRLLGRLDFTDDGGHIRELVDIYLKNSQNAVTIAAKANAPAQEETSSEAPAECIPAPVSADTASREIEQPAIHEIAPSAPAAAPSTGYDYPTAASETPKKTSKLRLLWLIPALLLLPIALVFLLAIFMMFGDPTNDAATLVITSVLFGVIPVGLDILFFTLALKKK